MEQLEIPRPFGTEGMSVHVRFTGDSWRVWLSELCGAQWHEIEDVTVRSSDAALAKALEILAEYREICLDNRF